MHLRLIVLLEAADELNVGAAEGVDVLIVVPYGQDRKFEVSISIVRPAMALIISYCGSSMS